MKVAAAQIEHIVGDLDYSLNLHIELIKEAQANGVDILLFPETSLGGYGNNDTVHKIAIDKQHPYLQQLAQIAPQMNVNLGIAERADDGKLYNTNVMLQNGKIENLYRKVNLPHYGKLTEKDWYTASNRLSQKSININAQDLRIQTLICADLWNPALTHCAMLRVPDILLTPICSMQTAVSDSFSNSDKWPKVLEFYAMIYATPTLMANYIDLHDSEGCWGGSCIIDAYGNELANAGNSVGLITADIDFSENEVSRKLLQTIDNADTELVIELLQKRLTNR